MRSVIVVLKVWFGYMHVSELVNSVACSFKPLGSDLRSKRLNI